MLSFFAVFTAISFVLIRNVKSTSDPTQNPTQPPTPCDHASYAVFKDVYDNEEFNITNKNIDSPILYAGESIVSQNCIYLLKLTKNGSLTFTDTTTGQVLWQTNSSLYNHSSTNIEKENLKFFLSNDELFIIYDKYPNDPTAEPYILWDQEIDSYTTSNDAEYRIIVNNDGYFVISTNDFFSSEEIYRRPKEVISTTMFYSTYTSVDNGDDGKGNDDKNGLSHLDWLWILFALLVAFCLGYLWYIKYCYKKYKVKHDIDLMVTTATVTKQEVLDTEAQEQEEETTKEESEEDEDDQINKWMQSEHTSAYTEIEIGGVVKGNVDTQEN